MELLTGKCKEDFEDWYVRGFHNDGGYHDYMKRSFYSKILSMQYGVLVDFFDSVGLMMEDIYDSPFYGFQIFNKGGKESIISIGGYNDRDKARLKAIEKANELYNENY